MNAAELIAELQKHPADMPVRFSAENGHVWAEVLEVFEGDEWNDNRTPEEKASGRYAAPGRVIWLDGGI